MRKASLSHSSASYSNTWTNYCGDLMYHGAIVPTIPIRTLSEFLNWLQKLEKKYCIAAQFKFWWPEMIENHWTHSLTKDFAATIHNFIDNSQFYWCFKLFGWLRIIRQTVSFQHSYKLKYFSWCPQFYLWLQNCSQRFWKISKSLCVVTLLKYMNLFGNIRKDHWNALKSTKTVLSTLTPLKTVIRPSILQKLAKAGIIFSSLNEVFKKKEKMDWDNWFHRTRSWNNSRTFPLKKLSIFLQKNISYLRCVTVTVSELWIGSPITPREGLAHSSEKENTIAGNCQETEH